MYMLMLSKVFIHNIVCLCFQIQDITPQFSVNQLIAGIDFSAQVCLPSLFG